MSISQLTLELFRQRNRIDDEHWVAAGIEWAKLQAIGLNYERRVSELSETAALHARLLQRSPAVHSVRWRLKDPEHALEKIVRKRAQRSEKYQHIDEHNYTSVLSDLVGLRALHLFKEEWRDIHILLSDGWTHSEPPVAYVREGDPQDLRASYVEAGCKVEVHPAGYRSVHYVVSSRPQKEEVLGEVQVRTVFEEGWSEVDHRVRYPNFSNNPLVQHFLATFNRIAGSADELASFVRILSAEIDQYEADKRASRNELEQHLSKIEELVSALNRQKEKSATQEKQLQQLANEAAKLRTAATVADTPLPDWLTAGPSQESQGYLAQRLRHIPSAPSNRQKRPYDIEDFIKATQHYLELQKALQSKQPQHDSGQQNAPPKKKPGPQGA